MPELTNEQLMNTVDKSKLGSIERQKRFILRQNAVSNPCPNCGRLVNVFEAMGIEVNAYSFSGYNQQDGQYHCPHCRRELMHIVPVTGNNWHWWLVPKTAEVPK